MTNEWLTTGQMIDRLKIGQVAKNNNTSFLVKRTQSGYRYVNKNYEVDRTQGLEGYLILNGIVEDYKWRILPNYVSFDESMKAFTEGKTVIAHRDKMPKMCVYHIHNTSKIYVDDILHSKWTIEADTQ